MFGMEEIEQIEPSIKAAADQLNILSAWKRYSDDSDL